MKKFCLLLICSILGLSFVACDSDKQAIIKASYGYLDAMGNYRIEEAAPFATEETKEATLKYISEVILPITDSNYIKSNTPANIEIVKVDFKNDSVAEVLYTKHTPIKTQEGTLVMHKCNDQWLAHVVIANHFIRPLPSQATMDSIGATLTESSRSGELKAVSAEEFTKQKQIQE